MKKISLLALLLGVILLFTSCGGLPASAVELIEKLEDEGCEVRRTVGEDRIAEYVEEYGLVMGDVTDIVHAEKKGKTVDVLLTLGTFFYCKDQNIAVSLKNAVEASLIDQFGSVNNPAYRDFTVEEKGNIIFFGSQKIWNLANE